jgi:hypothetical protein
MDDFMGNRGDITKTCKKCREQNKKADELRNREHRNELARVCEKKPEMRLKKCKQYAIKNNLDFELQTTYTDITKQTCFYCGEMDRNGFNGVDRVDNDIGYTHENSVPCCRDCNYMKGNVSVDVFNNRIEHILKTQKKIEGGEYHPECFPDHLQINYGIYKHGAIIRNYPFELTEQEFDQIVKQNCYICNKPCSKKHCNGIDRINNEMGYFMGNVASCCKECNFMKRTMTLVEMYSKMLAIYNTMKQK